MAVLPYIEKLTVGCLNKWGSHRVHVPTAKVGIKNLEVTHKKFLQPAAAADFCVLITHLQKKILKIPASYLGLLIIYKCIKNH